MALCLGALACGPIGPMPGGKLSGTPASPPSDWSIAANEDTVRLETRPSDPYTVNLWGVGIGNRFYLAAGRGEDARWVKHIASDPNVRLGIDDKVYELRAVRVTDRDELDRFASALEAKYDFEASPEQKDRARVFRLDPR